MLRCETARYHKSVFHSRPRTAERQGANRKILEFEKTFFSSFCINKIGDKGSS